MPEGVVLEVIIGIRFVSSLELANEELANTDVNRKIDSKEKNIYSC